MHKYSIIIPYRNREKHLQTILPRLEQKFEGKDFEIIVAEQDETGPFCKTVLMNTAVKYANGDILVFHDVDYYPMDNVSYDYDEDVGIYPVRSVIFLDENGVELPTDKIPAGYKFFKHDVGDHSGGVVIVSKENFYRMNGFNPAYRGWGKEDDDFLIRFDYHRILRRRNSAGTFLAMHHEDSAPPQTDADFLRNNAIIGDFLNTYWMGYANTYAEVSEFSVDTFRGKWLKMKNCREDVKLVSVTLPTRGRVKSLDRTLISLEKTIADKSQVEFVVRVDKDDLETVNYIQNVKLDVDVRPLILPRERRGYQDVVLMTTQEARVSRGKLLLWYADDCVTETFGWDNMVSQYQDGFGLVNTYDNENAPFNVVLFASIRLFRTMQWLGTHPYIDRWFDSLMKLYPPLILGRIDMHNSHIKDNAPSQLPSDEAIHPVLNDIERAQWKDLVDRVENHLRITRRIS